VNFQEAIQEVENLESQCQVVTERISNSELELKMAIATSDSEARDKLEKTIKGLKSLEEDFKSKITDLNNLIENNVEEHKSKSRSYYIKGQLYIGLGFLILFGGLYFVIDAFFLSKNETLKYISYVLIGFGLFIMVKGGKYHGKHNDELAYAGGHTEESWGATKQKISNSVREENEQRQKLAESIAKELKK
jgi:hypothetical protein